MAFEIKISGAPVHIGSFDFFDLMDSKAANVPATGEVVPFTAYEAPEQNDAFVPVAA